MNHARFISLFTACSLALPLAGCFIKPPVSMPDSRVIGYDGNAAVPPDCEKLTRASLLFDSGVRRPSMQWGCATYTNLAAQVANPQDLVNPQTLGPADAAVAASAVHRYETGQVIPLDTTTTTRNGK
ncbi:CpaD family pilus assembly lipoprotein [Caballeronia sp. LP006]|uniref:CpaD family pilus assembly lipoprotein n=1 Tax=unclassified Caballeronia TaxID=2646786 RepID=UPI001FD29C76|nr:MULTISPECIES: CpaD family pilus assembly lipoprotein [unclassified Caballeronia]MDR5800714.1 CpaD family pilus assembly lipoprotein [Caballeronia sp. LZ001]MDR5828918.1 CpaD family pilus assembly lipoprotein [Caballeronia sp. LP006]